MNYDTSFCADVGQVKTGNDIEDTYFKMLQEINRVTAGVANGVMGEYKTVRELVNACKTEGEAVVADVEVSWGLSCLLSIFPLNRDANIKIYKFQDYGKQNWYLKR